MSPLQKRRIKKMVFSVPIVIILMAMWNYSPFGKSFERITQDQRFLHIDRENKFSEDVIFIDIDETSVKNLSLQYGRWPWPRIIYKDLLEFISMGEPKIVLFDILFTEEQINSEDDSHLAEASTILNTSHAIQLLPETTQLGMDFRKLNINRKHLIELGAETKRSIYNDFLLPNDKILQKTPLLHVTNVEKDSDGVIRQVPLWHNYHGQILPSLTLKALSKKLDVKSASLKGDYLHLGKKAIPANSNGQFTVNYYDNSQEPVKYSLSAVMGSAQQILSGEIEDPEQLKVNPFTFADKIIILGGSANGLMDIKSTPISNRFPGPVIHATAISNILSDHYIGYQHQAISWAWSILIVLLIYAAILLTGKPVIQYLVPLGAFATYFGYSIYAFQFHDTMVPIATPLVFFILSFLDAFVYLSFVEAKEKKKISGTLSKYLSPSVANDLVERGINPTAEIGSKQNLSILFSDIRGFTSLSEVLEPEQVVRMLNEYLGRMTDIIFQENGTLDKFIGDAVMAFYGAPIADKDHALHAVNTAFKMSEQLDLLNKKWNAQGRSSLEIGIGINSGDVIVGNIGSERRLDYTVIGDHVNLASRVESLTKQYGVAFLITESTREMIGDRYLCRPIDWVQVKGKTQPVQIYEPLCPNDIKAPDFEHKKNLCEQYRIALSHYREGQFNDCMKILDSILENRLDDGPARVLRERCTNLILSPPSDWNGVYMAKSK